MWKFGRFRARTLCVFSCAFHFPAKVHRENESITVQFWHLSILAKLVGMKDLLKSNVGCRSYAHFFQIYSSRKRSLLVIFFVNLRIFVIIIVLFNQEISCLFFSKREVNYYTDSRIPYIFIVSIEEFYRKP